MPVIRGRIAQALSIDKQKRKSLLDRLENERTGQTTLGGPVIFEIPLEQSEQIDVMVVWDDWEGIRSEDRTDLIKEAYKNQADQLALALGVTYEEAIEQGLLPYRLRLRFEIQPDFPKEEALAAFLAVGGLPRPGGTVELRFPTETIAQDAAHELEQRLQGSRWIVNHAV